MVRLMAAAMLSICDGDAVIGTCTTTTFRMAPGTKTGTPSIAVGCTPESEVKKFSRRCQVRRTPPIASFLAFFRLTVCS
jgi:hypothetical protein